MEFPDLQDMQIKQPPGASLSQLLSNAVGRVKSDCGGDLFEVWGGCGSTQE